ncbi:hypothetical protein BCF33_0320 [Hasllibacter halocynthiae]|uniref:Uncharacterized protein n=1 Tax=Hasllibacter halocynthiae TaxID=595589 RepID=A0A2T0X772_9RHOB|nr:hypothetical protein [Hasllibacter halocynthiae]PRY94724.1 hypothetical protein BCF33_0320 [Hasllibacter halocynthiae]
MAGRNDPTKDGREVTAREAAFPHDHDPARDEARPRPAEDERGRGRADPLGHGDGASEPQGAARPEEAEMARARAATAAGRMPGTTHDPNSVTTMTDAEPHPDGKDDYYPPKKGEDERP